MARPSKKESSDEDQVVDDIEIYKSQFTSIEWWQSHIGSLDSLWHIRAYKLYSLWVNYHHYPRQKRINRLCSHWMDENEGLLEELVNQFINITGTPDSSFKLGHSLMYFYFLRELTRAHP